MCRFLLDVSYQVVLVNKVDNQGTQSLDCMIRGSMFSFVRNSQIKQPNFFPSVSTFVHLLPQGMGVGVASHPWPPTMSVFWILPIGVGLL